MKVLVTGATGWVGGAVVAQCITNPAITSVIALSRRPIDEKLAASQKVKVVLNKNFEEYSTEILEQIAGAEACIWRQGRGLPDVATARHVSVDFTLAGANVFLKHLAPQLAAGKRFVFAFCSGKGAEWDRSKSLWMYRDTRRIKGEVERGLLDLAGANADIFDVIILRPGGILADDSLIARASAGWFVQNIDLASAFINVCLKPPSKKVMENIEIIACSNK